MNFRRYLKTGKSFANRELVIYIKKNRYKLILELEYQLEKKLETQLLEIELKRYIRQSFILLEKKLLQNYIVIIARKPAIDMDCNQIKKVVYIHLLENNFI